MALQPNMQILNEAFRTAATEIEKFPNIPAIHQGNAILERLERLSERLDTRFDQLEARIKAADRNQITRLTNSTCTSDTNRLSPLVHAKTGEIIENFPENVRGIRDMRGAEVIRILRALDQPEIGSAADRTGRLITAVGVVVQAVRNV
ncbi:hypothetical protein PILCRDRAFT_829872 [Piloderma croceum F 1598]|uniref:Uncharacterized protein n=1 Tax=Piloderma croceum (strain F 1598) TaxID=765440 RepID=A0A0C3EWW1_PILCF|nr:hypothetical protein PILCRDRAFT_829872 [Piloderma croceum F 1598]